MIKVAISGATGRMGHMLLEAVANADDFELVCALTREGTAEIGQDAFAFLGKTSGVTITSDINELSKADVLIDFTRPAATLAYMPFCAEHNVGLVIGTTGFDAEGKAAIEATAEKVPVVFAPNMSVGVNAAMSL
ncbi:MAG: 4-hydroxy-tetrahydrodipicolinate reductase, partial [Sutterellaceae bacterium]|nr:4-hydroxy-tetrahydrodipicolinate reductase [Sutterellaceae bacterium]